MAKRYRFKLGQVRITWGADRALQEAGVHPANLLHRHRTGDWGEVSAADKQANDRATARTRGPKPNQRVLSEYRTPMGQRVWIITEADRSSTTIMLAGEY